MIEHTGDTGEERPSVSVLFLDDEEAILASLRSLFRHEGYTMHFFCSGTEALTFARQHPVDVIISDMRMPEMSGLEFLNAASAMCPEAVRIMLSGYEDKGIVINALSKGLAQQYLLKPWDDTSFKTLIRESVQLQRELRKQQLKGLLNSFSTLPSPAAFHLHLRDLLSNTDNSLKEVVCEIEKSPALVAKVLRVANSVYYSTRKEVSSVREAVVFIGTNYIASLVMAIEAFQNAAKGINSKSMHLIEHLWEQALRRAAIAKAIGERWPGLKDPNLAYIASLLQDVGYVVRLCSEPENYARMTELQATQHITKYDADVRVFVIPHDEVGSALLHFWNFPEEIVQAVAKHHRQAGDSPLAQIVQLAEALDSRNEQIPHDPVIDTLIPQWREKLHL